MMFGIGSGEMDDPLTSEVMDFLEMVDAAAPSQCRCCAADARAWAAAQFVIRFTRLRGEARAVLGGRWEVELYAVCCACGSPPQ